MSNQDNLILMVKCLHDVESMLKIGTREQLSKINLISIRAYCLSCMGYITKEDADDLYLVVMSLNAITEFCSSKLSEFGFSETDLDEKEFIVSNFATAKVNLCLVAGKYYTKDNKFSYAPSMNAVYKCIVDTCIENNYYFGLEAEIREGAVYGH